MATGALLVYWASIGRALSALRPFLLWATVIGGVITMVTQGFNMSTGDMVALPLLTILSFLSSSALLGSTCTAMILGHWYLVLPSMNVALLQSIVKFHIASTVTRILVVGTVVAVALASWAIAVRRRVRPVRAVSRRRVFSGSGSCLDWGHQHSCRT